MSAEKGVEVERALEPLAQVEQHKCAWNEISTWEGVVEKVSAKLPHWSWVLPQLSYSGRVLVTLQPGVIPLCYVHHLSIFKLQILIREVNCEILLDWTALALCLCFLLDTSAGEAGPDWPVLSSLRLPTADSTGASMGCHGLYHILWHWRLELWQALKFSLL